MHQGTGTNLQVTVNNLTQIVADNVVLTVTLPDSFLSLDEDFSPAFTTRVGQTVTFNFASIGAMGQEIVNVYTIPTEHGTFTTNTSVTTTTHEVNLSNNVATLESDVNPTLDLSEIVEQLSGFRDGAYDDGVFEFGPTTAGFLDGSYLEGAVSVEPAAETVGLSSGFLSGGYADLVDRVYGSEASVIATGHYAGVYDLKIVSVPAQSENSSIQTGLFAGTYTLQVIVAPSQSDASNSQSGFSSGAYV